MAGKSSHGSPDVNATHNNHQIEREENDPRFIQSFAKVDVPKKKTTFKITSVTKSARPSTLASQRADRSFERGGSGDLLSQSENDLDSLDDLDETVDSHTEDLSSEIFDTNSRLTDPDSQDPFLTPDELVKEIEPKEKPARFKVVKVETKEPFKRGRWICWDYLDAPDHKTEEVGIKPGSSTATGSVHYVHGIDDPSKNPLLAGASGTMFTHQQSAAKDSNPSTANTLTEAFKPIQPAQLSSHAGLISDPTFSSYVVQSSVPGMAYTAQAGISPSHSLPLANRLGGPMPVLPPMQQGETQTSQSLSGNIPFPTPDGQSHQLPIPQSSLYPSSGLSQPSAVARSVTSPHQPSVQLQDYVNAVAQVQVAASQDQHVPTYQQQMLYQEISSQPSAYSLNGTPFDGPQLTVNGTSINSLTSLGPEGMQDTRPNLGAGLAQIAVGGMSTAAPGEDDVTEEAFLQYFSNLSAYGSSGLFPPFLEESGEVKMATKVQQVASDNSNTLPAECLLPAAKTPNSSSSTPAMQERGLPLSGVAMPLPVSALPLAPLSSSPLPTGGQRLPALTTTVSSRDYFSAKESQASNGCWLCPNKNGETRETASFSSDRLSPSPCFRTAPLSKPPHKQIMPPLSRERWVSQSRAPPIASRRPSLRTQVRNHIGIIHSSTSAVAIDNKIEQAMVSLDSLNTQLKEKSESRDPIENKVASSMDLVKSHLMYAVREEVEVLKEVIKELMERLHKVEQENHLLRSEAAPHTLARLPPPQPPVTHPLLQQFMVSFPPPPPTSAAAAASQQQSSSQSSS